MKENSLPKPAALLSQKTRTVRLNKAMHSVPTPAFIFDQLLLEDNLQYLSDIAELLDIKIIFAQKSYSFYPTYPLISQYLAGSTASGLNEALLAKEEFPGEIHVFSPAYKKAEMEKLIEFSDHIYFNSFNQWQKYKKLIDQAKTKGKKIELALRINPEYSETKFDMYNPAGPFSRLGITAENFKTGVERYGLVGIDGLHFHVLCQENASSLAKVLDVFKENFGDYIPNMKWVNFGGGHHLTRKDYDVEILQKAIQDFKKTYPRIQIYLEPGEAISLDTGFLASEVLSVIRNKVNIGILDTSASCHMPDILEVPYTPRAFLLDERFSKNGFYVEAEIISEEDLVKLSGKDDVFRLAGPTCLAGDIIGNYRFPRKLKEGDRIIFCDMALYAHVKTNTFNGMPLPDLVLLKKDGNYQIERRFDYSDFKNRLGPLDVKTYFDEGL